MGGILCCKAANDTNPRGARTGSRRKQMRLVQILNVRNNEGDLSLADDPSKLELKSNHPSSQRQHIFSNTVETAICEKKTFEKAEDIPNDVEDDISNDEDVTPPVVHISKVATPMKQVSALS